MKAKKPRKPKCDLPRAEVGDLELDRHVYGVSVHYACERCGLWHRLNPQTVVINKARGRKAK